MFSFFLILYCFPLPRQGLIAYPISLLQSMNIPLKMMECPILFAFAALSNAKSPQTEEEICCPKLSKCYYEAPAETICHDVREHVASLHGARRAVDYVSSKRAAIGTLLSTAAKMFFACLLFSIFVHYCIIC